ncbi:Chymotrypsin/elastase isoinhibitors 2 to 5 [Toxocara canis]|uniref:Chymotrypsin/elastase isoinhibitors 2 to 5 n=1 Tax=Toxocara canis TaxID=6265 RepID=A0A0B2W5D7_TOXCA|nr:Chymotrypsin/elastase isoinhibitors 2 to 5 [Toxocara canis]
MAGNSQPRFKNRISVIRRSMGALFLAKQAIIVGAAVAHRKCGPNEEWTECTGCEIKCGQGEQPCPMMCRPPSCECMAGKGLRRTADGRCVPEAQCPKRMVKRDEKCGPNEKFLKCRGCEGTCKERLVPCPRMCKPPGCECPASEGFVRNDKGECIKFDDCPK